MFAIFALARGAIETGLLGGSSLHTVSSLRASALELLLFSALYGFLAQIVGSAFILGGAIACVINAIAHFTMARRHEKRVREVGPGA